MDWMTFNEWKAKGYRIKKGAKSPKRNEQGVPLFHKSQTYQPIYYGEYHGHDDWDDWMPENF